MFNLRNLLFKSTGNFKLEKTEDGQYMVTKKFKILYIGTKEKCMTFIENRIAARQGAPV